MLARLVNIIFAADCFLFTLATLGGSYPYESFSSAAWRAEERGMFYGKFRPAIDWLFKWHKSNHCEWAYNNAKFNLPEDQQ
jgi:hypothetical protein